MLGILHEIPTSSLYIEWLCPAFYYYFAIIPFGDPRLHTRFPTTFFYLLLSSSNSRPRPITSTLAYIVLIASVGIVQLCSRPLCIVRDLHASVTSRFLIFALRSQQGDASFAVIKTNTVLAHLHQMNQQIPCATPIAVDIVRVSLYLV